MFVAVNMSLLHHVDIYKRFVFIFQANMNGIYTKFCFHNGGYCEGTMCNVDLFTIC